ncbi:MAG: hypothetical protein KAY08_02175 [Giesbergeria sp.]|nr:hypothetical protein [Giesbergeria sp.]MBP8091621.1 hypothetical protein [Giesbergeria sp.]
MRQSLSGAPQAAAATAVSGFFHGRGRLRFVFAFFSFYFQRIFALTGLQRFGGKRWVLLLKEELLAQAAHALEAFFTKKFCGRAALARYQSGTAPPSQPENALFFSLPPPSA